MEQGTIIMTTVVEIFEFSLLYVNTLALKPQRRVMCRAQQSCSQAKRLKGLFSVSISTLSSRGVLAWPYIFFSEIKRDETGYPPQ